ncbi:signal sequence receptor delta [Sarcoptes scabiei]|nr:signal sequence receptor delta [Sarcoptes scabiei]
MFDPIDLLQESYDLIWIKYPETIAKGSRPKFWNDLNRALQKSIDSLQIFDENGINQVDRNYLAFSIISLFALCFGIVTIILWRWSIDNFIVKNFLIQNDFVWKRNHRRFEESFWNLSFYFTSFLLASYIVYSKGFTLDSPQSIHKDFRFDRRLTQIDPIILVLYSLEFNYYLYSMYAVVWVNEWKKDSKIMILHHLIASLSLFLSFLTKTYMVGVLVVFSHDICDVFLEGSKCLVKFRIKFIETNQTLLRAIGFLSFLSCWFYSRLYFFPAFILTSSLEFIREQLPYDWFIIVMILYCFLLIIFLLDFYWALLISQLVLNMAKRSQTISDIREIDSDDDSNDQNSGIDENSQPK